MSAEVVANKLVLDKGSKKIIEQMLDEAYESGENNSTFLFGGEPNLIRSRAECLEEIIKKHCECK